MTEHFRIVSRSPTSRAAERELVQWFRRLDVEDRAAILHLVKCIALFGAKQGTAADSHHGANSDVSTPDGDREGA